MKFLFSNLLNEGGAMFMYPTLLMLIICIVLIVKLLFKEDSNGKTSDLLKHISLFALVYGFLGLFFGLIGAFDNISSMQGDIATPVLAAGLKIGLLAPSFGMLVFLIARLGLLAVIIKK
ncbi:hypothetical protein [Tenacibaculum sp. SDUM215027]|uniref:hypothetical protein n=1 Tax=Tenacibaculum sp. SDUM215027 TaxID=3422596 RepID=UPI003D31F7A4